METPSPHPLHRSRALRAARTAARGIACATLTIAALWCLGAILFDGPFPGKANLVLAVVWLALAAGLTLRARSRRDRWISCTACLALVVVPWSFKRPSNTRDWSPEYARVTSASIDGDRVTISNFRNFAHRHDGPPEERWESRTVRLSELRGIDLFLNYWGSPLIAHPVFSFDFGEDGRVAFSIETRRENGETYTALGGLYKLYELSYLAGDERDFILDRTNIREGEDTYLFRLAIGPEKSRARFLEFVEKIRELETRPRFYNVIMANCTTAIRSQIETADQGPFDWRLIANGKLDELLHERGLLVDDGLSFRELKRRAHINGRARDAGDDPTFSGRIREDTPGFRTSMPENP